MFNDENKRAPKRVKFSPSTKENNKDFLPLAKSKQPSKKQDMNKLISGVWIRLSEAGEYDLLTQRLQEFGLEQMQTMDDFFRKEGPYLLRCSTLHWRNPEHLRFICEHVPKELLREVLRENNYSNISGFLLGHTGMEEEGLIDKERIKERNEKLKLLVKTDPKGLEEYTNSEYFENRFSEGVKASFQKAVKEYKSIKKSTLII